MANKMEIWIRAESSKNPNLFTSGTRQTRQGSESQRERPKEGQITAFSLSQVWTRTAPINLEPSNSFYSMRSMLNQGETRKLPIIYKISMQMQPQCLYWHPPTSWEGINFVHGGVFLHCNTRDKHCQCNLANYIPFLVHFVTAGPVINIKFDRERDFNTWARIIHSPT